MRKTIRIAAAAVILVGCLSMVVQSALRTTITYYLPPRDPGGEASRHVTTFEPAVVATVVTAVSSAVALGWLLWNLRRRPPGPAWILPVAALLVSLLMGLLIAGGPQPDF